MWQRPDIDLTGRKDRIWGPVVGVREREEQGSTQMSGVGSTGKPSPFAHSWTKASQKGLTGELFRPCTSGLSSWT